jgi:hypothetical protein
LGQSVSRQIEHPPEEIRMRHGAKRRSDHSACSVRCAFDE